MKDTNKLLYLLLFVFALAVNFAGINVKFFTDDQGLYASVAKNMVYRHDFLQLFTYNLDWLDKPHFPFWAIYLSFKIFGISEWAYRLPAFLFFLLSLIYTYLFSRKYYGTEMAVAAVLITMTALNTLLSNTDVRAEPYLMALIIGSIYHISQLEENFSFVDILLAALLTAFALMTKGIFVLTAIYGGLIGQLIFNKKLKSIFQFKWIALFLLTLLFALPELYALYIQFDIHPEKTVFGTHHVSGIKWFLWDSQFGRFVNNGPISHKTKGSIFFFFHTLLWAFAPWCLLFYYAIFRKLTMIYRQVKLAEYYTITGGLMLLLLFSLSRFQLPFYTNAVFPLFAIVTANLCNERLDKFGTTLKLWGLWLFIILLPLLVLVINFLLKPINDLFFAVDCVLFGIIIFLVVISIKDSGKKAFLLSGAAALFSGLYVNSVFYNEIIPFKGQIAAAEFVNQERFDHIYTVKYENNTFQFYCKKPVVLIPINQFANFKADTGSVFYADQVSMNYFLTHHVKFKVIKAFINYPQENILPNFIRKAKRTKVLDSVYVITN